MSQEQRVVAYSVTEKTKSKKGKKSSKKEVSKIGLFHVWSASGKGAKKFTGLVEDAETGLLIEVNYKNIRFLSEAEIDELTTAAITEAENILDAIEAAAETETAEISTETATEEETTTEPAAEAPAAEAKPRRGKKV